MRNRRARRRARRSTGHALLLISVGAASLLLSVLPGTNSRFPMTLAVRAGFAIMGAGGIAAGALYWKTGSPTGAFGIAAAAVFVGVAAITWDMYARSGFIGDAALAGLAGVAAVATVLLTWTRSHRHKS